MDMASAIDATREAVRMALQLGGPLLAPRWRWPCWSGSSRR